MNLILRRLRWVGAANTSASAIAYTIISRIGVLAINVATGILIARTLGPANRGAASAVTLWPVAISALLSLGIPVALRYYVPRRPEDARELFSVALIIGTFLGFVAVVAGLLFLPHWLKNYSEPVVRFAQAMMFFAPLISVNTLVRAFLESQGEFTHSNSMVYLPTAATLVSLLVLFKFKALTAFSVPLAYEVPFSCVTVVSLYRVRRFIHVPFGFIRRSKLLLHFGSRAYGLDIISTLSAQLGQVIVIGLLSAGSFGLFTVAANASGVAALIGGSLNTVLFPKAAELETDQAIELVNRSARLIFATNIIVGTLLILAMPVLIGLTYGSQYTAVIALTQVLTCDVIFGATIGTLTQAFMATGRPGLVTVFQVVALCTTFPLMLVLIPKFGLMGVGYAALLSTALRLILVLGSYPVFLKHRIPGLLLTSQDMLDIRARVTRALS